MLISDCCAQAEHLTLPGVFSSRMLPNPRHDITSSSGPLHPVCETGVRTYAQGFGAGRSCCKLDMEIGVTSCVLRPALAMEPAQHTNI